MLLVFAGSSLTSAQQLSLVWRLDGVFTMPESAALSANAQYIYVSNVNEYARDGNGFITRVSIDGSQLVLGWIDDLDSPTGLALFDNLPYFADFDTLVVAASTTGEILRRYVAPDTNPSLNDVAVSSTVGFSCRAVVVVIAFTSSTTKHLTYGSTTTTDSRKQMDCMCTVTPWCTAVDCGMYTI
ncbi:MAG: hypothetical protein WDZ52_13940 [Pseudohongiellaceae bacterium]